MPAVSNVEHIYFGQPRKSPPRNQFVNSLIEWDKNNPKAVEPKGLAGLYGQSTSTTSTNTTKAPKVDVNGRGKVNTDPAPKVKKEKVGTQKPKYTSSDEIKTFQEKLKDSKYNVQADGIWGPETQSAYEAYIAANTSGDTITAPKHRGVTVGKELIKKQTDYQINESERIRLANKAKIEELTGGTNTGGSKDTDSNTPPQGFWDGLAAKYNELKKASEEYWKPEDKQAFLKENRIGP